MELVRSSAAEIKLSQEDFDNIEKLAACSYSVDKIAMYLDVDVQEFFRQWSNAESLIRFHYEKGKLEADYEISGKLLDNARSGNITAVDTYEKRRNVVELADLKKRIFNDG